MDRPLFIAQIKQAFRVHPVVALLGPRQCGKTTLARVFAKTVKGPVNLFDLENPRDLARLQNPMLALEECEGLVIIDEIQRLPDLFLILRVLVDRPKARCSFLILGSASRELIKQSSESLAGRMQSINLSPFGLSEVGDMRRIWLRGGFPRSYLARSQAESLQWRNAYIKTFLEQDIPALGISIPSGTLRRFWTMLAHYHGNVLNLSEIGTSFGIAHTTVRHYIDILVGTFMVRELHPWWENVAKRQIKSPKIYMRDSGIFHSLMNINVWDDLQTDPKLGASWEGFALEQVIGAHQPHTQEFYFWGTHAGAELDLMVISDGRRIGYEFKHSDTPKITKSMHIALTELNLDQLWVVVPKSESFAMAPKIRAIGIEDIGKAV